MKKYIKTVDRYLGFTDVFYENADGTITVKLDFYEKRRKYLLIG